MAAPRAPIVVGVKKFGGQILKNALEGEARTRPNILRLVLGPYVPRSKN